MVLILAIPVNIVCLAIFMYIYFSENKSKTPVQEYLKLSMVEESRFNHRAYSTLSMNEGRYVSFFNWGANVKIVESESVF